MPFASLGLRAELLRALDAAGYTVPTPVQAQAIPVILAGRDILAGAQTGTGKTAAFTLPLLQRLNAAPARPPRSFHPVRALILTPTRELAAQVEESVRVYGEYLPLTSTVVFGGVNIQPQIQALRKGVDILVATPGRLLDHVQQRTVDLSRVEILVLDEADRMLDMGFIRDIRRILDLLPVRRQNLLFSATFSDEIKALADGLLDAPTRVEVARKSAESDLVAQSVYFANKENKKDLLVRLLADEKIQQALVFTRTKHGADRLVRQLQRDGISAVPIHGNRSQSQRTRALDDFKAGRTGILVATDIAARGLDIEQLPHVINYELPNVPEDYVHRIGRTGRAGSVGEAISLVSAEEEGFLADIERLIKKRIVRREAAGFAYHFAPAPPKGSNTPCPSSGRPAPRPRTANRPRSSSSPSRSPRSQGR
ncbi:MAG TPA: DEAD/DEAH box helicase [Chthonomonadaceae bacterium]|nr:DEAD/DEAH box helicase [Chthonomonadaceae bacterium]